MVCAMLTAPAIVGALAPHAHQPKPFEFSALTIARLASRPSWSEDDDPPQGCPGSIEITVRLPSESASVLAFGEPIGFACQLRRHGQRSRGSIAMMS